MFTYICIYILSLILGKYLITSIAALSLCNCLGKVMSMRTFGVGKIRKMHSKWQLVVPYREMDGAHHTATKMTPLVHGEKTRAQAEELLLKWRDSLVAQDAAEDVSKAHESKILALTTAGIINHSSSALQTRFQDYATKYINDRKLSRSTGKPLENMTKNGYHLTLKNQVIPYLPPDVKVCDVSHEMVEDMLFLLQVEKNYSSSTVTKALNLVRAVLNYAQEHDGLQTNACRGIRAPKKGAPRLNVLYTEEVPKFAAQLASMQQIPAVTTARLALSCGMRVGEIAALTIGNCSLQDGFIHVIANIAKSDGLNGKGHSYKKEPKTEAGKRDIPINSSIRDIIESRKTVIHEELSKDYLNALPTSLHLVGDLKGNWTSTNSLSKQFSTISKSLNISGSMGKPVTLQDLRHTFATYALAKHANIKDVQAILGHASAQVTLDIYAASDPTERISMMEMLAL